MRYRITNRYRMDAIEDCESAAHSAKAWIALTGAIGFNAPRDAANTAGFVKAWVALRRDPWHVIAPFGSEEQARIAKRRLGHSYDVYFGFWRPGSNEFHIGPRPVPGHRHEKTRIGGSGRGTLPK